jgi:hypothetical protein
VFKVQASHLILQNGEKIKIHSPKVREKLHKKQEWTASINKGKNTRNTPNNGKITSFFFLKLGPQTPPSHPENIS